MLQQKGGQSRVAKGDEGERTVMSAGCDGRYAGESQFWETVASLLKERSAQELQPLFDALARRSSELGLPMTFGGARAEGWAFVCRMFCVYHERMASVGRKGYKAMTAGTKRVVNARFAAGAFKRIAANITYPSSPGRAIEDSVADTFLANGLVVTEGYEGPSMDGVILSTSLADSVMMDLCRRVITPPPCVWEDAERTYPSRRPGLAFRYVLDLYFWIFAR